MNELNIKLSAELMEKVNKGNLKTIELVNFILDTTPCATTSKELNETAIKDISFNGQYAVNARIDINQEALIITLPEDSKENTIETNSALKSNTKFTDGIREFEIIEYIERFKMYRLRNYTDNKECELMKESEIQTYIDKKEYYEERLERGKKRAIEYQLKEELERAEAERKQKEYEFCYGFVDDKSKLQQGKILKTLNKEMRYQGNWYSVKGFIEHIVKAHPELTTKEFFNNDRHSKKKRNGCYEKLVDKMEYSAWWITQGIKTGVDLTKTEYDYCNYLISNKLIKVS